MMCFELDSLQEYDLFKDIEIQKGLELNECELALDISKTSTGLAIYYDRKCYTLAFSTQIETAKSSIGIEDFDLFTNYVKRLNEILVDLLEIVVDSSVDSLKIKNVWIEDIYGDTIKTFKVLHSLQIAAIQGLVNLKDKLVGNRFKVTIEKVTRVENRVWKKSLSKKVQEVNGTKIKHHFKNDKEYVGYLLKELNIGIHTFQEVGKVVKEPLFVITRESTFNEKVFGEQDMLDSVGILLHGIFYKENRSNTLGSYRVKQGFLVGLDSKEDFWTKLRKRGTIQLLDFSVEVGGTLIKTFNKQEELESLKSHLNEQIDKVIGIYQVRTFGKEGIKRGICEDYNNFENFIWIEVRRV